MCEPEIGKYNSPRSLRITFLPEGKSCDTEFGQTVLTSARLAGVDLVAACGGFGSCGTCLVKIIKGEINPITSNELEILSADQIQNNLRLACQVVPLTETIVLLQKYSAYLTHQFMVNGTPVDFELSPPITAFDVHLDSPTLQDPASDFTHVNQHIQSYGYFPLDTSLDAIRVLPTILRENHWQARLAVQIDTQHTHLIAAYPPKTPLLGLAVDIGSTKLAFYLVDLENGITLTQDGILNPQTPFGDDVISRIAFVNLNEQGGKLLHRKLIASINQTIVRLCKSVGQKPEQIVEIVAVGNPTMHHFFVDLPVSALGSSPYIPAIIDDIHFKAAEIGINVSPGGLVYMPPLLAGFIGSDHISAFMAAIGEFNSQVSVLIDIGTNTEISLVMNNQILSCSTASGPAFEGAHIQNGIRASEGAIEQITINNENLTIKTIGNLPPTGLCGTGLLNSISVLLSAGILNRNGTFNKKHPMIIHNKLSTAFPLALKDGINVMQDILLTTKDIRQVQLAKAAIRTGIEILLKERGINAGEVDAWYLAGGFGTYLDVSSAIQIGLLPGIDKSKVHQVGNAAGMGAKAILLSQDIRRMTMQIPTHTECLDLTTYPGFSDLFIDSLNFPEQIGN
jgi:uncharacterized 2Fe-2S/4Fe-4S cluster protein (DUF4445 family)